MTASCRKWCKQNGGGGGREEKLLPTFIHFCSEDDGHNDQKSWLKSVNPLESSQIPSVTETQFSLNKSQGQERREINLVLSEILYRKNAYIPAHGRSFQTNMSP
jgi:hypothetical protein